jgi:hypothetical protein
MAFQVVNHADRIFSPQLWHADATSTACVLLFS